ncbi:hypothetical protein NDN08_002988 [Rhodosorus marinus]|uniref:Ribosomal protein L30 ferredoxin-like fold domain-containing protein n=1 Tax=Rhodosorus marinus TaxID=101924 RepID=A0AAV8UVA1_9RHOD|nr:hypothetical protein NDN08_002988 [Rhodosorus marinus]
MSEMDLKSALRVPETVLKRKRAASFAAALNSKKKRSNKTKSKLETSVKRAEKFVTEFRNKERSTRRAKSVIQGKRADSSKRITIAPADKVLLVIRIRAGKKDEIPSIYAKTLKKFSLNKLFSARLIRHNKDNLKKLKTIEEYVTWGSPNLKLIKDLVHKRGYTRVDKVKRPLSDNTIIEEKLGDCGIICTEDLVHVLASVDENFDRVSEFLCPFQLGAPKKGFTREKKLKNFAKGGEYGSRGEDINELVAQMN